MTSPDEATNTAAQPTTKTMKVGVVAERLGLSVRSLHYWEEMGLVTPSARTTGGFRLYTDADLDRLILIRRMKPLGFTLEEMKALLAAVDTLSQPSITKATRAAAETIITDCRRHVSERRVELQRLIQWADEFHDLLATNTL